MIIKTKITLIIKTIKAYPVESLVAFPELTLITSLLITENKQEIFHIINFVKLD